MTELVTDVEFGWDLNWRKLATYVPASLIMHHPVLITLFGVILHPAIGQNNSTSEPNTSTDER